MHVKTERTYIVYVNIYIYIESKYPMMNTLMRDDDDNRLVSEPAVK